MTELAVVQEEDVGIQEVIPPTKQEATPRIGQFGDSLGAPGVTNAVLPFIVALVPVLTIGIMGFGRRWMSDDGFINQRIVANLLDGYGPVYNVDERVEAHTNALWVGILAAWGLLGGNPQQGAMVLGIFFSMAGVLLGQMGAVRLLRAESGPNLGKFVIPIGMIAFASIPAAWDFVTSGLETGLMMGWLGLSFWLLSSCLLPDGRENLKVEWPGWSNRHGAIAAFVFGLGPLIRPDLWFFSLAWLAALGGVGVYNAIANQKVLREVYRLAVVAVYAGAIPVSYQIFRMGYFAGIVPNTALSKEASRSNWPQGWKYLNDFVGVYHMGLPLAILAVWWLVRIDRNRMRRDVNCFVVAATPVVAAIVHVAYVVRVGGDFMHGRMLLPGLFAFLLPAAVLLRPLARTGRMAFVVRTSLVGAALGWCLVCGLTFRLPYTGVEGPDGIADERGYYVNAARNTNPVTASDFAGSGWARDGARYRGVAERLGYRRWAATQLLMHDSNGISFPARSAALNVGIPPRSLYFSTPSNIAGYGSPYSPVVAFTPSNVDLVTADAHAGGASFYAGPRVHVIDTLGALGDPIGSRFPLGPHRGRPGHEKGVPPEWYIGRFAELNPESAPQVVAASEALRCGELAELRQAITAPLTLSRFSDNVKHAWGFYKLRIPMDPFQARIKFCGETQAGAQASRASNSHLTQPLFTGYAALAGDAVLVSGPGLRRSVRWKPRNLG